MHPLFLLNISALLTHELDAMTAKEWLIFPGLSRLDDERGRKIFVWLHIPLFAIILWGITGPYQQSWRWGLDWFSIAHVFAHILFHRHPKNGFRRPMSWIIIVLAGLFGALDLLMG